MEKISLHQPINNESLRIIDYEFEQSKIKLFQLDTYPSDSLDIFYTKLKKLLFFASVKPDVLDEIIVKKLDNLSNLGGEEKKIAMAVYLHGLFTLSDSLSRSLGANEATKIITNHTDYPELDYALEIKFKQTEQSLQIDFLPHQNLQEFIYSKKELYINLVQRFYEETINQAQN